MAEGFHDFAAAEILTAANTDDYLMRQTVMRFASAAARDSALSGVLVEGLVALLKDTDTLTVYSGSAWVTIAYYGAWSTWTPVVGQAGIPITSTVTNASYERSGKRITGAFQLIATSTGGGGAVEVTAPVTCAGYGPSHPVGMGYVFDTSAGLKYSGQIVFNTTTVFRFLSVHSTTDGRLGATDFNGALQSGDVIAGSFQYEAASAS